MSGSFRIAISLRDFYCTDHHPSISLKGDQEKLMALVEDFSDRAQHNLAARKIEACESSEVPF
jgi:hypothetical protein